IAGIAWARVVKLVQLTSLFRSFERALGADEPTHMEHPRIQLVARSARHQIAAFPTNGAFPAHADAQVLQGAPETPPVRLCCHCAIALTQKPRCIIHSLQTAEATFDQNSVVSQ